MWWQKYNQVALKLSHTNVPQLAPYPPKGGFGLQENLGTLPAPKRDGGLQEKCSFSQQATKFFR